MFPSAYRFVVRIVSLATVSLAVTAFIAPPRAFAGALEVVPTRAAGMGGALRGAAVSSAGPALNPSGMSLSRSYVAEAEYRYLDAENAHIGHVAIADSTSGSNIGGGVSYTYATSSHDGAGPLGRQEVGLSLSFPLGDRVAIGATGRYLWLTNQLADGSEANKSRMTFDAGLTLRPSDKISIGAVGYGLRDLHDPQSPRAYAGGIALLPVPEFVLVADVVLDPRTYVYVDDRVKAWTFMGGVEYTFASKFGFRAGGGHDGLREVGYGTAGLTALGDAGAIDLGGRLDFGASHSFTIGLSLRLFVPAP